MVTTRRSTAEGLAAKATMSTSKPAVSKKGTPATSAKRTLAETTLPTPESLPKPKQRREALEKGFGDSESNYEDDLEDVDQSTPESDDVAEGEYIEDVNDLPEEEAEVAELNQSLDIPLPTKRNKRSSRLPKQWKNIVMESNERTHVSEETYRFHTERFLSMFREALESRRREVVTIRLRDVHHSPYTLGFWAMLQPRRGATGDRFVDDMIAWLRKHMDEDAMEILGRDNTDGKPLLELPAVSKDRLIASHILYVSVIVDTNGDVVGVYDGSGTDSVEGGLARWGDYERASQAPLDSKLRNGADGSHIVEALRPGRTWHLRPLLVVDPGSIDHPKFILLEGLFCDVINCLYTGHVNNPYRSQWVIESFERAVPEGRKQVSFMKLNRAHQMKQGARTVYPNCAFGCCEKNGAKKVANSTLFLLNGEWYFGCQACYSTWRVWARDPSRRSQDSETVVKGWIDNRQSGYRQALPSGSTCHIGQGIGPRCSDPERKVQRLYTGAEIGTVVVCWGCASSWTAFVKSRERLEALSVAEWTTFWNSFVAHRMIPGEGVFEADNRIRMGPYVGQIRRADKEWPPCRCGSELPAMRTLTDTAEMACETCYRNYISRSTRNGGTRPNVEQLLRDRTNLVIKKADTDAAPLCPCNSGAWRTCTFTDEPDKTIKACRKCKNARATYVRMGGTQPLDEWLKERIGYYGQEPPTPRPRANDFEAAEGSKRTRKSVNYAGM